jgi:hypothetical protein
MIQVCSEPVFIIGSPRSGTTILAWSLGQHSALWTSGESYILFDFFGGGRADAVYARAKDLSDGSWLQAQNVSRQEFLASLGIGINALFSSRSGGRRWIDHTPHYALMANVLADMFPGARFLHILRDGRRVVNSMVHFLNPAGGVQGTDENRKGRATPWATDFRVACRTWRSYLEAVENFAGQHEGRCLTCRNEELVTNPEDGFRKILAFLEVPYEEEPAAFFQSNRINSSFRPNSRDRSWVQSLSDPWSEWTSEQKAIFMEEAGETLVRSGYAAEDDPRNGQVRAVHEVEHQPADHPP